MDKTKLVRKFDKQAEKYAKKRNHVPGSNFRKKMFSNASGKTLEAAVGVGYNFSFYPKSIELTAVDFSPKMLDKAKKTAESQGIRADFILSDVENLSFQPNSFDTITSSGSLCAYEDPVHVLNLFNKWCKDSGRILLLEHGKSTFRPVGWIQSGIDPLAMRAIGCHQDRDIKKIVAESDLEIEKVERHFLGYLYLIWAKPSK